MRPALLQRARPGPRAALAASIAARDTARSVLKESTETLARANEAARLAEAELGRYADLDQDIAKSRAAMLKSGESRPLPDELIAKRKARDEAREHLDETRLALNLLNREQGEAQKSLQDATQAVTLEAYRTLLLGEGEALCNELQAVRKRQWDLTDQIRGLDLVLGASLTGQARAALGQAAATCWLKIANEATAERPGFAVGSPNDPVRQAAENWRNRHAELLTDPNADLAWK